MKRGKINLKFLQYPGKIVDVDLTWAYTVVFIFLQHCLTMAINTTL